jgi:hypothetical protein
MTEAIMVIRIPCTLQSSDNRLSLWRLIWHEIENSTKKIRPLFKCMGNNHPVSHTRRSSCISQLEQVCKNEVFYLEAFQVQIFSISSTL